MRTYGYLCYPDRPVKDDAASLRSHFRNLIQAGLLPDDWDYRAHTRRATHELAIDVVATSPRPIYAVDPHQRGETRHPETGELVSADLDRLTREAHTVRRALEDLHAGHNWDGDDVKFYGEVTIRTADGIPSYWPAGQISQRPTS